MPDDPFQQWHVHSLILATKTHAGDLGVNYLDEQNIADVDLASLGKPKEAFRKDTALLRKEHALLSEMEFNAKTRGFFCMLLARPSIYYNRAFQIAYEEIARANLQRFLEDTSIHA